MYAATDTAPATSMLNYVTSDVIAQMAVVKLGSDGKIKIFSPTAVDVIVDVQGYFSEPAAFDNGSTYTAVTPVRAWDTRSGGSGAAVRTSATSCDRMSATEAITLDLTGVAGLPADGVDAVVLNLTAVSTLSTGHFTAFATGGSTPSASSINYQAAETLSNSVTAGVDADGKVTIAVSTAGSSDLVVDISGWYSRTPSTTAMYAYDGDGYRAGKLVDGALTSFTWDRSDPIPKMISTTTAGVRTYVIYGPGGAPLAQVRSDNTGLVYYHHDQIGSTRALTDANGAVVGTFSYDPYGAVTDSTGTATPLLGYAGEYLDVETGYIYLRARYYDPTTAHFLTRDPLEQATGEAYAYAGGNPVSNTDPTGMW